MGPVWLLKLPPPPPPAPTPNSQRCQFFTLWPTYEKRIQWLSLMYIYVSSFMRSPWHFGTPESRTSEKWRRKTIIHTLDFNWKSPYQITSIFYIGERIAEKHDGSTIIIEGLPRPQIKRSLFEELVHIHVYENQLFILVIAVHNTIG